MIEKRKLAPALWGTLIMLLIYVLTISVEPGWITWLLQLPAMLIICTTALVRAYDISGNTWAEEVRKLGMVLVGTGTVSITTAPIFAYGEVPFPTWRGLMAFWGFALAWLTTPEMPPWWKYVTGQKKLKRGQKA